MNILIPSLHILRPPHFETELELMYKHLAAGDDVFHLGCNAGLPTCDLNRNHDLATCAKCILKRSRGTKLLPRSVKTLPLLNLTREDHRHLENVPHVFKSLQELKAWNQLGFDLGLAVSSSLISTFRDPNLDTQVHARVIHQFLVATLALYCSVRNYLKLYRIDRVYLFNGRFAYQRAAMRACEHLGVEYFVHERGQDIFHYALFHNSSMHDMEEWERLIRMAWDTAGKYSEREEIAASFFIERANGHDPAWPSYVLDQEKGLLPSDWDSARRNIVVFNTSDDEFAAIDGNWDNRLYGSQLEGVRRIVSSLDDANPDRLHLYLRMHPSLKNVAAQTLSEWYELSSPHLTLIRPDSPVSTYALMRAADKVVTFMSTTGIEGVYWKKPVILAGPALYRGLGGTYNPETHEELLRLLGAALQPREQSAALMYGYFMKTFGIPYELYRASGFIEGKFLGIDLNAPSIVTRVFRHLVRPSLRRWLSQANVAYVRRSLLGRA